MRVLYINPLTIPDYLPLDAFIKFLIIVTWIRGTKRCIVRIVASEDCGFMHNFLIMKFSSLSLFTNLLFMHWYLNYSLWYSIAEDNTIHIYNSSSQSMMNYTVDSFTQKTYGIINHFPFEGVIGIPSVILTKSYLKYYILVILLHILPALFIDGILKLLRFRPM